MTQRVRIGIVTVSDRASQGVIVLDATTLGVPIGVPDIEVRRDAAGNLDTTPATRAWNVAAPSVDRA